MVVVVSMSLAGCGHKRVQVANTREGNACNRQCMEFFNDCYAGKRKNLKTCQARENDCLRTCPGASGGVASQEQDEDELEGGSDPDMPTR